MSTKTQKSAGTQYTPKGPTQGNVLVDPKTGDPINTVGGKLDVNASVTATIGDIEIHADTSSIRVEDPDTNAHVKVETDGSINVNVKVDAADGDSVKIVGTENGTPSGIQHTAKIGSDLKLEVKDTAADASLASIDTKLSSQATAANQATANASLASIDSKLTNPIPVTGPLTDTQLRATPVPVSMTSAPLPADAARESKQDIGNASLASIDSKLSTPMPVDVDAKTGDNVAIGNTWKKRFDEASPTVTYIGLATPGTATSVASWQIKRVSVVGSETIIEFAAGSLNFNQKWDDRAILAYS